MFNKKRLIWSIGIVIVLIIIVAAGAKFSPKNIGVILNLTSSKGDAPLDGNDKRWETAKDLSIPMTPQAAGDVQKIDVKSLIVNNHIYFRLVWADKTKNNDVLSPRDFSDAVAVEVAQNKTGNVICMGVKNNNVNIWYWKAFDNAKKGPNVQNLIAGGPGSLTPITLNGLLAKGSWEKDEWTTVIGSPLSNLKTKDQIQVAFAVWDGSKMERNGMKSVSNWVTIPIK